MERQRQMLRDRGRETVSEETVADETVSKETLARGYTCEVSLEDSLNLRTPKLLSAFIKTQK